ncbi:MAG TPA: hypothetical protein PK609_01195 [Candidatus Paceibacterota bacterium]|nr:hypothetical protein [Candidatus Paceibacterota bacterium]
MTTLRASLAFAALTLLIPASTHAQTDSGQLDAGNVGRLLESMTGFIDDFIIPFVWAIAVLMFIWGMVQYFIIGGANEEKREEGKQLAIWGVVAFFVMSSLWGIVNILDGTFKFGGDNTPPIPTFDTTQ